jgi:hypothetical protein
MGKFLTLEGEGGTPRRRRRVSLMDVCGLAALPSKFLTPAEATARQAAQSSAWGSKSEAEKWATTTETEQARARAVGTRKEMFIPVEIGEKSKSLFSAYGLKGVDELEAGRLAVCALAYSGELAATPTHSEVHAIGTLAAYALMGIEPLGADDQTLAFWKRLRRAVTPPRAVRKALSKFTAPIKKVLPPKVMGKVTGFVKKGLRYTAAAGFSLNPVTMFMPGVRNKLLGLKGGEMRFFDQAVKSVKALGVATASIVCPPAGLAITAGQTAAALAKSGGRGIAGILGQAAIGAVAGKFGGAALGKFGGAGLGGGFAKLGASSGVFSKFSGFMAKSGTSFLGKSIAGKVGSVLIKDKLKGMILRVGKDKLGKFLVEKFDKNQVPQGDYENMPDGEPVPITQDPEVDSSNAATIAGSTTMAPGELNLSAMRLGEDQGRGYPADAVQGQTTAQVEARLDPADQGRFLTPAQD